MKKIFSTFVISLLFFGFGCNLSGSQSINNLGIQSTVSQPLNNNPKTTNSDSGLTLQDFLNIYTKAPTVDVVANHLDQKLSAAFAVNMPIQKCNANNIDSSTSSPAEEFGCCDPKTHTFTPTLIFYVGKTSQWQKGGLVNFYVDPYSGFCADGGFLTAQGPFQADLLKFSQEAANQRILLTTTTAQRH